MAADEPIHPTAAPPATLEEIAALAGVSPSTVSRALRGREGVGAATAERIRAIAAERRYLPHHSAVRLRRGRSQTVAVAVPALDQWYFSELIAGVESVLVEHGYATLVAVVSGEGSLSRILADAHPGTRRVDAVITVDLSLPETELNRLAGEGTVLVTTGRATPFFSSVMIDDIAVGQVATSHLIGLGHRHVGLLKGLGENPYRFDVPDRRRAGYLRALRAAGIDPRESLEVAGNFSLQGGSDAVESLLAAGPLPTALFCMSDQMAVGATKALRDRGLRVPDDMSIIGVDDHPMAASVGLTTIRQDVAAIGACAARLAITRIDGDETIRHEVQPATLVVRRSTRRQP